MTDYAREEWGDRVDVHVTRGKTKNLCGPGVVGPEACTTRNGCLEKGSVS